MESVSDGPYVSDLFRMIHIQQIGA